MPELLPGTEVNARALRWELVYTQNLGGQTLHRLRGVEGCFAGKEIDLLEPFEEIVPIARDLRPEQHPARVEWRGHHLHHYQSAWLNQYCGGDFDRRADSAG